ncbi:FG-GAP repeat domain-containing protein [Neolewinella agarilytica]|uniref:Repeat domain-containing protein n=1 Tax=Neolewinella agarilytica TaxID=478744 RepID=A0A1H8Z1Y0_9BACT|nr:VCBS repeat-containing protein [Neolewinella agarilytica]SEP58475.1 Repeat domain-containing protein [Neolewinella agarilytica]
MKYLIFLSTLLFLVSCTEKQVTTFTRLSPSETGITFTNLTGESDSFNILTNEYIYNGGGVGIGDFDQDGLPDVFFSGSDTENQLYLNRGDWTFEDVSQVAGIGGGDNWNNGVTVVDVNNDGLDDIYVCSTMRQEARLRANQLYLNQGKNANGIPTFINVAAAYGIADTTHNTQAAWLDYDQDGDLDLFLLVNEMIDSRKPNQFSRKTQDGSGIRTDKLYRQDEVDGQIRFTEVGKETGILFQGFALAVTVTDFNRDGWPDLYISNDYLSNDLAYLNTKGPDGGRYFVDIASQLVKHTSYSAMGNDVADMNNDGIPDIVAVDMLPADNLRRKMMLTANNYTYLINLERYGYHPQFTRNTLQISQGIRSDSMKGLPQYSELAMQAGLPATDWSWTPLVADFNLDGNKDVIITNGFPRDITDKDFGDYNAENSRFFSVKKMLEKIPSVKIPNVAFRARPTEDGVPIFDDVTEEWGIDVTSFSNGAAYADFDRDGDLDYIVNNIDDPAHVYRNNTISDKKENPGFLRITVDPAVRDAAMFGAEIEVMSDQGSQVYYLHPHRGYLSSTSKEVLAAASGSVTVKAIFPGQNARYWEATAGSTLTISPDSGAKGPLRPDNSQVRTFLRALPSPAFTHVDKDYIDFNVQPMLLHKLSQQGPGLAVTDWNNDGIDDIYVSGSYEEAGTFLQGTADGFEPILSLIDGETDERREELGALFFDADGDGDEDLYVVSGSYEFTLEDGDFKDRFYRFENGRYVRDDAALAGLTTFSGSCVRAADYDNDGDLDLFVGGRVEPHKYPSPVASLLLRNESSNGTVRFIQDEAATAAIASAQNVCDALFTDYDNDGDPDLLLAGEWSPLRLYANDGGQFNEITEGQGLAGKSGWWNSLAAGDFDNDGDTDYLAGNLGDNSILRPTQDEPVTAILTDLDQNGGVDFIPFTWFTDASGKRGNYPYFNRNDFAKQVTKIKSLHKTHNSYAAADKASYLSELPDDYQEFSVNYAKSVYLENTPEGFVFHELPAPAQSFPVFGMLPIDLNDDDFLDLLVIGNDHGSETAQGFMDAGNGLQLLGRGDGSFFKALTSDRYQSSDQFVIPGEGRALVLANAPSGTKVVASQNSGPLVVAQPLVQTKLTEAVEGRKSEVYWGSGYLGQSMRARQ